MNPEPEHRTQFVFKVKREHIVKVNIPTFNIEVESKGKTRSVVNNVGRALVKKKVPKLESKEIDTLNQSYIYDTYKYLYLSKKEREEKLLQVIQSATGLKARVGATKADGTALTVTTERNAIKKTVSN